VPLGIGPLELAIVLVIILVIFGPKRLPGLGKQLGTSMREFKDSVSGGNKDDDATDQRTEITAATAEPPVEETKTHAEADKAFGRD